MKRGNYPWTEDLNEGRRLVMIGELDHEVSKGVTEEKKKKNLEVKR